VVIVVGYRAEQIRTHCQSRVRYLVNDRYADTNSLYSLWLARQELTSGAMILNSDVVVPRLLFERLLAAPAPDAILVEVGESFEPEDMKVRLDGRRVIDFGKDLVPAHSNAHNVGVAKFSADGAVHLVECVERLIADGRVHDWAPAAFREFAVSWPLVAVDTAGLPWIEIDFVEDLIRARTEVDTDILKLECAVPA
jgi:choline kinase